VAVEPWACSVKSTDSEARNTVEIVDNHVAFDRFCPSIELFLAGRRNYGNLQAQINSVCG